MADVLPALGVIVLLTITPGVDMALVARSALSGGRRAGAAAASGIAAGTVVWGLASAAGVAAILAASSTAYDALRIAGAAYLILMGVRTWRAARDAGHAAAGSDADPVVRDAAAFRSGLTTNLANPKIAVFYSTVAPAFVPDGAPVPAWTLAFAAVHALAGLVCLTAYAALLSRMRAALDRPSVRAALDRVTGTVLVAFGLRLAVEHRR